MGERSDAVQARREAAIGAGGAPSSQVEYPWRSAIRTGVWVLVAFAPIWPLMQPAFEEAVHGLNLPGPVAAWCFAAMGTVSVISTLVTRLAALPEVDGFVRRFLPWLAPSPGE